MIIDYNGGLAECTRRARSTREPKGRRRTVVLYCSPLKANKRDKPDGAVTRGNIPVKSPATAATVEHHIRGIIWPLAEIDKTRPIRAAELGRETWGLKGNPFFDPGLDGIFYNKYHTH